MIDWSNVPASREVPDTMLFYRKDVHKTKQLGLFLSDAFRLKSNRTKAGTNLPFLTANIDHNAFRTSTKWVLLT